MSRRSASGTAGTPDAFGSAPAPAPILLTGVRAWVAAGPAGAAGAGVDPRVADAVLVRDGHIAWAGRAEEAPAGTGTEVFDACGAVLLPGFVDGHAHVTETGRALASLDVTAVNGAHELLDAVARAAATAPAGARILGHGWDESAWADPRLPRPEELESAAGGREVFLSRVDVHAGLASAGLLARAGVGPDAALDESDHAAVRALATVTSDEETRSHQAVALRHFASTGHSAVTEMAAPHVSGEADLRTLLEPRQDGELRPTVYAYWARLVAHEAQALAEMASWGGALSGLGGDLSIDGSLGARTAALRAPYADAPHTSGELLLEPAAIGAHLAACTLAGTQAAFHAIGDAGVDAALEGLRLAASAVGEERLRAARHRLEHVEGIDARGALELARYGVLASVQPRFDELWGFDGDLYEQRLGAARAAALNPFGTLAAARVQLALGSDTPVTGASPWLSVRAALRHHSPEQRLAAVHAFEAHTVGGHAAARAAEGGRGTLAVGAPASLALWQAPDVGHWGQPSTQAEAILALAEVGEPACLLTLAEGAVLHRA